MEWTKRFTKILKYNTLQLKYINNLITTLEGTETISFWKQMCFLDCSNLRLLWRRPNLQECVSCVNSKS